MEKKFRNDPEEFELQKMATKKVVKLKSFYTHLFIYIVGVILYILKDYFGLPLNVFPVKYLNGFVMFIWTAAFIVSAIDIFASYKIFGEEWEERKMKSILEREKTKNKKWE